LDQVLGLRGLAVATTEVVVGRGREAETDRDHDRRADDPRQQDPAPSAMTQPSQPGERAVVIQWDHLENSNWPSREWRFGALRSVMPAKTLRSARTPPGVRRPW